MTIGAHASAHESAICGLLAQVYAKARWDMPEGACRPRPAGLLAWLQRVLRCVTALSPNEKQALAAQIESAQELLMVAAVAEYSLLHAEAQIVHAAGAAVKGKVPEAHGALSQASKAHTVAMEASKFLLAVSEAPPPGAASSFLTKHHALVARMEVACKEAAEHETTPDLFAQVASERRVLIKIFTALEHRRQAAADAGSKVAAFNLQQTVKEAAQQASAAAQQAGTAVQLVTLLHELAKVIAVLLTMKPQHSSVEQAQQALQKALHELQEHLKELGLLDWSQLPTPEAALRHAQDADAIAREASKKVKKALELYTVRSANPRKRQLVRVLQLIAALDKLIMCGLSAPAEGAAADGLLPRIVVHALAVPGGGSTDADVTEIHAHRRRQASALLCRGRENLIHTVHGWPQDIEPLRVSACTLKACTQGLVFVIKQACRASRAVAHAVPAAAFGDTATAHARKGQVRAAADAALVQYKSLDKRMRKIRTQMSAAMLQCIEVFGMLVSCAGRFSANASEMAAKLLSMAHQVHRLVGSAEAVEGMEQGLLRVSQQHVEAAEAQVAIASAMLQAWDPNSCNTHAETLQIVHAASEQAHAEVNFATTALAPMEGTFRVLERTRQMLLQLGVTAPSESASGMGWFDATRTRTSANLLTVMFNVPGDASAEPSELRLCLTEKLGTLLEGALHIMSEKGCTIRARIEHAAQPSSELYQLLHASAMLTGEANRSRSAELQALDATLVGNVVRAAEMAHMAEDADELAVAHREAALQLRLAVLQWAQSLAKAAKVNCLQALWLDPLLDEVGQRFEVYKQSLQVSRSMPTANGGRHAQGTPRTAEQDEALDELAAAVADARAAASRRAAEHAAPESVIAARVRARMYADPRTATAGSFYPDPARCAWVVASIMRVAAEARASAMIAAQLAAAAVHIAAALALSMETRQWLTATVSLEMVSASLFIPSDVGARLPCPCPDDADHWCANR